MSEIVFSSLSPDNVEAPPAYKEIGNWKAADPSEQKLGGNWWEIFQDPQLNALEQQVNISNQNLKIAQAQYTQARALLRYNRADYFPTIAAAPSATRGKVSRNRPTSTAISNGKTTTDLQLPLELSYEIDAWGRDARLCINPHWHLEQVSLLLDFGRPSSNQLYMERRAWYRSPQ